MKASEPTAHLGSLTIVGTGIRAVGQLTLEAKDQVEIADKLFYLVTSPAASEYLVSLNRTAESLQDLYGEGKPRIDTYREMAERILVPVRHGKRVCAAFYGHPGVFATPSHEAIRRAREEGFHARMLPAPSAEDCLIADLGFDPAMGCQSFEATNFLLRKVIVDPSCLLILWQIGVLGDLHGGTSSEGLVSRLSVLVEYLRGFYKANQPTIIYEASIDPASRPRIDQVPLSELPDHEISSISTLCIPPARSVSYDSEMVDKLGLDRQLLSQAKVVLRVPKASVF
jgi:uncharacterized protein YabN with tetrapyrrole methylase and pyrophosphatase domain